MLDGLYPKRFKQLDKHPSCYQAEGKPACPLFAVLLGEDSVIVVEPREGGGKIICAVAQNAGSKVRKRLLVRLAGEDNVKNYLPFGVGVYS